MQEVGSAGTCIQISSGFCRARSSVLRPVFKMSQSRPVNFVGTSRLGLGYKIKCLGLGHEGLVYSELYVKFLMTLASLLQPV